MTSVEIRNVPARCRQRRIAWLPDRKTAYPDKIHARGCEGTLKFVTIHPVLPRRGIARSCGAGKIARVLPLKGLTMTSRLIRSRSFAALFGTLALVVPGRVYRDEHRVRGAAAVQPAAGLGQRLHGLLHGLHQADHVRQLPRELPGARGSTPSTPAPTTTWSTPGDAAELLLRLPHRERRTATPSPLGPDSLTAGYDAVPDAAYHDVQCESCHGPGYTHVSSPSTTNHPLARAGHLRHEAADRQGHHRQLRRLPQRRARALRRAVGPDRPRRLRGQRLPAGTTAAPGCGAACHEGRTALARFNGEPSHYVEKDSVGQITTLPPATCAVCHDPHGSPYQGQLRAADRRAAT